MEISLTRGKSVGRTTEVVLEKQLIELLIKESAGRMKKAGTFSVTSAESQYTNTACRATPIRRLIPVKVISVCKGIWFLITFSALASLKSIAVTPATAMM